MLKEVLHFLAHAPQTFSLSLKLPHPEFYDTLMLRANERGMAAWRTTLVEDLRGEVLEIGCGTGLMFNHYPNGVRLFAVELVPEFLELAIERAAKSPARVSLLVGDGLDLPFSDRRFDYVIFGLVLCSVTSVPKVLSETRRVLKPGGEVRLIEHVRSTRKLSGVMMDLVNPLWRSLNGQGCNLNRPTEALLQENGYQITQVKPFKIFSPGVPAFPMRWMRAVPA